MRTMMRSTTQMARKKVKRSKMIFSSCKVRMMSSIRRMRRPTHLRRVYVIKAPEAPNKTLEPLATHPRQKKLIKGLTVEASRQPINHST